MSRECDLDAQSHDQRHPVSTRIPTVESALIALGRALQAHGYEFVTVTPCTHARVLRRAAARGQVRAADLRDVFGWSMPCSHTLLPREIRDLLFAAGACREDNEGLRSTVRFSTLGGRIFAHSAFPTTGRDAVFFGPDTYRFVRFVVQHAPRSRRLVDVGCGSGAGGIALRSIADHVVLADINPRALSFSRVNAELAGVEVEVVESDILEGIQQPPDLVVANPPFMADDGQRSYRDGGGTWGEELSIAITMQSLQRLAPGGTLLLYTGAPIVAGKDMFLARAAPMLRDADATFAYEELDPDVFGEELETPRYEGVERIAVVGLRATVR